ncbi:MAG: HTTM domain-containing protein [Nannocystaceae bacterium]
MSTTLMGIADRVVNEEAVALSPTLGWLLLACATALGALFILQADRWRRLWMRTEDPRALGLFRVLFALFVLFNINGLWEHFTFLFTDEGIFFTDTARQVLAGNQFAGFGDGRAGDSYGFFDPQAVIEFLKGPKYSLLFFWDSPTAFWIHLAAFEVATILFALGYRTRLTGVLSFLLMNSIMVRNPLFWEGTDLVYRVFFFILILSRSGHAYSVDNWLRCRRLRKEGRLSERGGPGGGAGLAPSEAHPRGLEAVYRRIPGWPRLLMILQLATIYVYTGSAKTGMVWLKGDTLYYALNMDHFYRVPPQYISAIFGTNAFRVMTWVVHIWQCGFPLMVAGLILRWALKEKLPPLRGWRLNAVRACWVLLGIGGMSVALVAYPVHYRATPGGLTLSATQGVFAASWLAAMALIAWGYRRLRDRPFRLRAFGEERVLDLEWFASWFLGRRVWLTLGIMFHVHLLVLMNIGMFAPIMLLTYMVCLSGPELATMLRALGRGLSRLGLPWIPADVKRGEPRLPTEDPTLPHLHHDAAKLPEWALAGGLGLLVGAVALKAVDLPGALTLTLCAAAGLTVVAVVARRRNGGRTLAAADRPWAYGPLGRLFVRGLVLFHITAVAVWCLPAKDCLSTFRAQAQRPFSAWLLTTQTNQGWNMFAPNPPRSNVFLKVLVTDQDGEVYDMNTDVYAPEQKPIPWIWNDRMRKMNRRVSGGESGKGDWYQKWLARYHCREWARTHGGQEPEKVELVKVWYRIPSPEQVRDHGWYIAEHLLEEKGHERKIHTITCAKDPEAQLPDHIRARYGLPPLAEGAEKPWFKHRKRTWDKRRAAAEKRRQAKEARRR